MLKTHDLVIIGSGPAGCSAAVYAARYELNTLVFGKESGGVASTAPKVENWPGIKSITGIELMAKFKDHADSYENAKFIDQEINDIKKEKNIYKIHANDKFYKSKAIILALGLVRRKLNIPGEKEFTGKGIAYCATCDAAFFKNKTVAVVGGANSAVVSAMLLTEFAKKVYIIYRKDKLRAEPIWIEKIKKNSKIEVICCANVIKAEGEKFLQKIKLDTGKKLKVDGLFIEIGAVPSTIVAKKLNLELDKDYRIKIDAGGATNIKGVFAAGDITNGSNLMNQIVTAASEGAIAAESVYRYLKKGVAKSIKMGIHTNLAESYRPRS